MYVSIKNKNVHFTHWVSVVIKALKSSDMILLLVVLQLKAMIIIKRFWVDLQWNLIHKMLTFLRCLFLLYIYLISQPIFTNSRRVFIYRSRFQTIFRLFWIYYAFRSLVFSPFLRAFDAGKKNAVPNSLISFITPNFQKLQKLPL